VTGKIYSTGNVNRLKAMKEGGNPEEALKPD
jgi:hypothetical protein